HRQLMQVFQGLNWFDRALTEGKRLFALEPDDLQVAQDVASLMVMIGQPAEAEQVCRQALKNQSDHAGLTYLLAEACHGQDRNQEATQLIEPVLQKQPDFWEAMVLRAVLHVDAKEYDRAIPLLRQAVARRPDSKETRAARYFLSMALDGTGQKAAAARERDELLREQNADILVRDARLQPDNLALQAQAAEILL